MRPSHYKVVSISLYTQDQERLAAMVARAKQRGHTKASKSEVIRLALERLDVDAAYPDRRRR